MALPPPPPRTTGDSESWLAAFAQWAWSFYQAIVLENLYVTRAEQASAGDFDPTTLPDPSSASAASAQQTANEAYALADQADGKADTAQDAAETAAGVKGQVTVSGVTPTASHTFAEEQEDTSYFVLATAVASTGTPASGSAVITEVSKTTTAFTITVETAPGSANTVTFDFKAER
jgi:hypothetical protein